MSINSSTGAFSWTPSEAQGGTAPSVTVTVTDNGTGTLSDSETFTITVGDTNVAAGTGRHRQPDGERRCDVELHRIGH